MASNIEVLELAPDMYYAWDEFTGLSPQGSIFSTTSYLAACQADFKIVACRRDEQIIGGIVLTKSKWGKHTNPLLCKYLGVLLFSFEGGSYQSGTSARKVQQLLIEFIGRKRGFNYMFHPAYTDWLPFHWSGYSQMTKYTYRITLDSGGPAASNYNSRLRGKINKAGKDGIAELVTDIDLGLVFEMMDRTFHHQKEKNPFKRQWLDHYLHNLLENDSIILTGVRSAGGDVTAVLGMVRDANAHYLLLNGINHDRVVNGQNEWLIDQAIQRASGDGAAIFDFEGSMIRSIESFYRQFGGELTPYFEIRS